MRCDDGWVDEEMRGILAAELEFVMAHGCHSVIAVVFIHCTQLLVELVIKRLLCSLVYHLGTFFVSMIWLVFGRSRHHVWHREAGVICDAATVGRRSKLLWATAQLLWLSLRPMVSGSRA